MLDVGGIEIPSDHFINGRYRASADRLAVVSPIDGTALGSVANAEAGVIDEAVTAARSAFKSWSSLKVAERTALLKRFAQLIRDNTEPLAQVECQDSGALLAALRNRIVARSANNIEFFADYVASHQTLAITGGDNSDTVMHAPAGVAALITPWNAPLMLSTWKLGPALAAGNAVILKPPELAPASCALLAQIATSAGIPAGVFNVVHGAGVTAGASLAAHPGIDRISFTGSSATGRLVATATAKNLVPVSLELGGKSPLIVFESAELTQAADTIAHQYFNAGQVCLAGTRVLVQDSIAAKLMELVRERVTALVVGDPRSPATNIGPLISAKQFDRVQGFVDRAIAAGAVPQWGGGQAEAGAGYFQPTLLTDIETDAEIVQHEVFGPVLTWQTFDTEEQAIEMANATRYGLAASIWTLDRPQAERVGAAVSAGTVWVNSFFVRNLAAPFGGFGESGIGIEGGAWSYDFFSNVKNLSVNEQSF